MSEYAPQTSEVNVHPVWNSLIYWLVFSVCVALSPILIEWLISFLFAGIERFYWMEAFSHGELLIISTALTGESLGYLAVSKNVGNRYKIIGFLACFLVCLGTLAPLGAIDFRNALHITAGPPNVDTMGWYSIILFGITVVVGCFCKRHAYTEEVVMQRLTDKDNASEGI